MQLLNTESWVNATVERDPQPGQGIPQKRSHFLFRERCKTTSKEFSRTILPALAVNCKYAVSTLLGGGKNTGEKNLSDLSSLELTREQTKTSNLPSQAIVPRDFYPAGRPTSHGGTASGSRKGWGHFTGDGETWDGDQLERAGFSPAGNRMWFPFSVFFYCRVLRPTGCQSVCQSVSLYFSQSEGRHVS